MAFNLSTNILPKPRRPSCLRREGQRCQRRMSKQRLYRNVADAASRFDSIASFAFFLCFLSWLAAYRRQVSQRGSMIEEEHRYHRITVSYLARGAMTKGEIYRFTIERARDVMPSC